MKINKYKRGVITLAIGNRDFVEMAVDMALSYRLFNSEPVSCIVDRSLKAIIDEKYSTVFDKLILIPEEYTRDRTRKFICTELSPYESTIFIDADILLLNNISHLWDEAESQNFVTMIGHYIDEKSKMLHHGLTIKELLQVGQVNRYLKTNSGFFYFAKEKSNLFFRDCIKNYHLLSQNPALKKFINLPDEIAIGITGSHFNIFCFGMPSPMIWNLSELKKGDNKQPLCHFIGPIPYSTVKWLVKRCIKLRKLNQVPTGGEKIWIKVNDKYRILYRPTIYHRIKVKLNKLIRLGKL